MIIVAEKNIWTESLLIKIWLEIDEMEDEDGSYIVFDLF